MGSTSEIYDPASIDTSDWLGRELCHRQQAGRILSARLGDIYLGAARCYANLGLKHSPRACGLCVQAVNAYQLAGLSRAAKTAWRWARRLHDRRWRDAVAAERRNQRRVTRPATARQLELAEAVDRITRERGRPPSWRELAADLGIGLRTARDLGYRCREKGLVSYIDGVPRSIATTNRGRVQGGRQ